MKLSIAEIETMDRASLIVTWGQLFGTPVPQRLSRPFLRRYIAFEVQARRSGRLPHGFVTKLTKAARKDLPVGHPVLKPGGRLIREWNGVTHTVDVVENGFLWNGARYTTLSPIARAITGARWSGPRFFGLKKSSPP